MTQAKELGFIGIGRMGAPMVKRLLDAGYTVTVFDTSAEAVQAAVAQGAQAAASPQAVADAADTILLSLPTPVIVEKVAGELILGSKLRTVIDLSTTGPKGSEVLDGILAGKQIALVDAPVSGGVSGAAKGTLAIMVAGAADHIEQTRAVLEVFGKVFVVGEKPGMGQTIKVINNLMSATAIAITSEALVLGKAAGLDPDLMLDIINASSGRNNASEDKFPRFVLPRTFDFGFALELSDKDTRLCVEYADSLGMPLVVGSAVRQMLKIAMATEGRKGDLTSMIRPMEDWMKVEVKGLNAKT